jgi:hypothetical protein
MTEIESMDTVLSESDYLLLFRSYIPSFRKTFPYNEETCLSLCMFHVQNYLTYFVEVWYCESTLKVIKQFNFDSFWSSGNPSFT